MLILENDDATRGEQVLLRAFLRGTARVARDWPWLRADDFSADVHGRIFRHVGRVTNSGARPTIAAVLDSMQRERGLRVTVNVADYLGWLAGDDAIFTGTGAPYLIAFQAAALARRKPTAVQNGGKS